MPTGEQQGNVCWSCLIEPAGDWFSELDVIYFPFSLQITNTFREVFRLRDFVVYLVLVLERIYSTLVCSPQTSGLWRYYLLRRNWSVQMTICSFPFSNKRKVGFE